MTNLVSHVREAVREHPEATALSVDGSETSYAEFWALTGRFAGALKERGVGPGDRIALYLPNLPQYVVAFHGALRAGAIVVPVNPQYKSRELRHILGDSTAGAIVTTSDRVPEVEDVHEHTLLQFMITADGPGEFSTGFTEFLDESPEVDFWSVAERADDETAVLPYTSGTTGQPKGVRLTHGNLSSNTRACAELVPDGVGPDDGAIGVLPLFHIYGMTVVMNTMLTNGGTYYPVPQWDAAAAMSLVDEEEISIFHGVPAMYNDMVNHPDAEDYSFSSVRLAGVGGSGIPVEVLRAFEERFDATIYEGYGLTETSPVTHFNDPERGRRVGSIGKAIEGVDAMVVDSEARHASESRTESGDEDFEEVPPVEEGPLDEDADLSSVSGEIVVAGPNVMAGYLDNEAATDAAFTEHDGTRWFHTGDAGYHDEDGYFYVVDRQKDVVVTAGYNVYPREVEELLFEHDAVADAAVVGIPDERRGETVKAYVVRTPGSDVTETDLREFCLDNLAEYKHPRVVEFVDELPRTTTGKVKKYELREASDPVAEEDPDPFDGDSAGGDPAPEATDGASEDPESLELRDLSGISEHRAETLREAGFDSVEDLIEADHDELAGIEGFGDALASRIKRQIEPDAD